MKWTRRKAAQRSVELWQEIEDLEATLKQKAKLPWPEYARWAFGPEGEALVARKHQAVEEWSFAKLMAMPLAERVRFFRKYRI